MKSYEVLNELMKCRDEGNKKVCNSIIGAIIDNIYGKEDKETKNIILRLLTRLITLNNANPYMPIMYIFDGEAFEGTCVSIEDPDLFIVFNEDVKYSDGDTPLTEAYIRSDEMKQMLELTKKTVEEANKEISI